jgi:hypothetical protein
MCIVRKPAQHAKTTTQEALNFSAPGDSKAKLYRARFNHVGRKLVDYTIKQTDAVDIAPQTFIESDVARMKAIPFGGTCAPTTRAFERILSDVIGPVNGLPPTVPRWAIVFKDEFTSYVCIYMMHHKSEAPAKLQLYINEMGAGSLQHTGLPARASTLTEPQSSRQRHGTEC